MQWLFRYARITSVGDWLPSTYQDDDNTTFHIDTEEVNRIADEVISEFARLRNAQPDNSDYVS